MHADACEQDEAKIAYAAAVVHKDVKRVEALIPRGWGAFRLKRWDKGWDNIYGRERVLMVQTLGTEAPEQQVVVFVAVDDLDESNGFFTSLKSGYDVCVDDKEDVHYPLSGGGLGLWIVLAIIDDAG